MSMKSLPRLVWIVPAILLAIAVSRLPYGYYTFVRIVTCGAAALIAFVAFKERAPNQFWTAPLALMALLFNPLIPIHLDRATWFYLDLGASVVFIAHLFFVRQKVA
jgi:hypothetical protein